MKFKKKVPTTISSNENMSKNEDYKLKGQIIFFEWNSPLFKTKLSYVENYFNLVPFIKFTKQITFQQFKFQPYKDFLDKMGKVITVAYFLIIIFTSINNNSKGFYMRCLKHNSFLKISKN
jgi:hypothetical protein